MKNKSVAVNAGFNIFYKVLNMLFPLVTSIYVSHVLLADGIGKVSSAQNIVQYFVLLAPLGISNYGIREIAKSRTCKEDANKLFSELVIINTISTTVCTAVYYLLILSVPKFENEKILYLVAGLPIVLNYFNLDWFFKGYEEYAYISIRSSIVKILSLCAILVFVRTKEHYIRYAFIYTIGIAGNYFFNLMNLYRKKINFRLKGTNCKQHLKPISIFLFSCIAIELYTLLDTTMLNLMCSDEVVGFYSNSIKLERILVELIAAIGGVLLPRLSYYHKNGQELEAKNLVDIVFKITYTLAIPCAIGVLILADRIVPLLFGESFVPAITTVRFGTPLIIVLGFSSLFGTQVLLTYGKEKKLLISTLVGAGSNIVLNLILIPFFKNDGAIIASVISETLVTVLTFVFSISCVSFKIKFLDILKVSVSAVAMGIVVYFLNRIDINTIVSILICVLTGVLIFILMNYILKTDSYIFGKKLLISRIKKND